MGKIGTPRHQNLLGQRFGRLVVIAESEQRTASRGMMWVCRCDCGREKTISAEALVKGVTVSCGCYNKEVNSGRAIHEHNRRIGGRSKKSPTYISWEKMLSRCYRKTDSAYKWYGEKGISVCERWHSFKYFLEDMGERPKNATIDRINSNGNYEPSNCRWADSKTQANNTARNVRYEYKGEMKTISELTQIAGLKYDTMWGRLRHSNFNIEDAMNLSLMKGQRYVQNKP